MPRRKASWSETFVGEIPAAVEKEQEKTLEQEIHDKIFSLFKAYDYKEIAKKDLIYKLARIYGDYFVYKGNELSRTNLELNDKMVLVYSYKLAFDGTVSKKHRWQTILDHFIETY